MTSARQQLLVDRQSDVARAWLERLLADYPNEAKGFFAKQRAPFSNPVGATLVEQIELLTAAVGAADSAAFAEPLSKVVKIRAVQDLDCRQAVGFVFALKDVLRELGGTRPDDPALDRLIDQMALDAFAAYTECREQLAQIRVAEAQRLVSGQLRRLARLDAERSGRTSNESLS